MRPTDRNNFCREAARKFQLGRQRMSQGWALAYRHYSTAYVGEEDAARAAHLGIWRSTFTAPWDWRRGDRAPYAAAARDRAIGSDVLQGLHGK